MTTQDYKRYCYLKLWRHPMINLPFLPFVFCNYLCTKLFTEVPSALSCISNWVWGNYVQVFSICYMCINCIDKFVSFCYLRTWWNSYWNCQKISLHWMPVKKHYILSCKPWACYCQAIFLHCAKKPVTTMLTYPWKCTVLHCNHLGNTWKPLVLMTRHFDYHPR